MNIGTTYLLENIPNYTTYAITTIKKTANLILGFRAVEIKILSSYPEITNSDPSPVYAVLIDQILIVLSSVAALSEA